MALSGSFKRPGGLFGWIFLLGVAIDWMRRVDFVAMKLGRFVPDGPPTIPDLSAIVAVTGHPLTQFGAIVAGLLLIHRASRKSTPDVLKGKPYVKKGKLVISCSVD